MYRQLLLITLLNTLTITFRDAYKFSSGSGELDFALRGSGQIGGNSQSQHRQGEIQASRN